MISVIFRRCTATMSLAVFASACVKFQASTSKAGFTYTKICNGRACTVAFTNTSKGAVSYWWDFGDDSTSVEANPVHSYAPGTGYFNVTLEAIGQDNESQVNQTINIYE